MTAQGSLLITQGDVAGIGPEVVARAFLAGAPHGPAVVVGDVGVMRRAVACIGGGLAVRPVPSPQLPADWPGDTVPVWQVPGLPPDLASVPFGRIDARAGAAAAACIEAAVRVVRAGEASAIVTAPIHKEALAAAGVPYPGHTEMLQALSVDAGAPLPPVRMMLANDELRTVLVTIHMSLRRAIDALDFDGVLQTIRIAHGAMQAAGIVSPRIAVAGLNPHAGEGGHFGDEELRVIGPAVAAACAEGIDAQGPFAPDTVFMRARHVASHAGEFDVVVSMVHDHGLIAVKYLGVEHGVNVTLGLPFVRTSPDHGTAFDLAGTGRADPSSLLAAMRMAREMVAQGRGRAAV